MEQVAFHPMGKKNEFIRIRADDALKEALAKAAEKDIRTEADEARYLLMKALGLLAAEDIEPYSTRSPRTHPDQKKKGAA